MTFGCKQTDVVLSYITDLDPLCALSLAATASPFQAQFLRDFMYKYLACRTFIGVQIPVSKIIVPYSIL